MRYLVDSNIFIQAHLSVYPFDVATTFWVKLKKLALDGVIFSIDKVKNELYSNEDALTAWCKANLPHDFFVSSDDVLQNEYTQIVHWANSKSGHYLPLAITEFLDFNEADAFIVAYGLSDTSNMKIVTHEVSQPGRKNKIKMPEPCNQFGIPFINTVDMFRELGETF